MNPFKMPAQRHRLGRGASPRSAAPRNRQQGRLRVEQLEDRTLLSGGIHPDIPTVIEDFEDPNSLAAYTTVLRYAPAAELSPDAAHDGGLGLVKHDGYEWLIRNDLGAAVQAGETISVWVDFAGTADGRAYFGFGATPNDPLGPLSTGGTLSLVLAPNTDQILLQDNSGFAFRTLAAQGQYYQPDHWYRLEVDWGTDGTITGQLFDSDGVTLLNSVSGTDTAITAGGIAFRGFGSDKYFDTVTVDNGSGDSLAGVGRAPRHAPVAGQTPPKSPPPINPLDGPVLPFSYQSVAGTGLDIALAAFNQLQQVAIVGDTVGLAAANTSANVGSIEMGWGPVVQGLVTNQIPVETPLLQQYIFRQLPGEATELIGESDLKHFFDSSQSDTQHLAPGEQDTYGAGLNADQDFYSSVTDLNPVTGAIDAHALDYFGPRNVDDLNQYVHHNYDSPVQYLLQVNVADLDPAQNPVGTRWFLGGNLWVPGDQNPSNNSRWVEITPHFTGSQFTFTYPSGSGGQYDLRTIPGMGAGPAVIGQTPLGTADNTVSNVRVTFNRSIDPMTFTPDQVSFTGPNGAIAVTGITVVAGSNNTQFDLSFDPQGTLGVYTVVIGPNIQDASGNAMDQDEDGIAGESTDQYTGGFAIKGPKILSSTPTAGLDVYGVDHVRVTFNKAIDPATFTPDQVVMTGSAGPIDVTGIVAVAGSGDKQFDIQFAIQTGLGTYALVIGPNIDDLAGNAMDQNGNYVAGEVPNDQYRAVFTITSSTVGPDGFGYTGTVAPFQAIDILNKPGTFTIIAAADDLSVPVDLGSNTFNFYGLTYTGNNRLFVSSNGLTTFGSANSEYANTDLTNDPTQPAISPLWADWIKDAGDPTGPMVVGKFATFNGTPVLVIEWNQVRHYGNFNGRLTFQAVLQLNTGSSAGEFGFNYLNLQSGDIWAEGNNATVGIKAGNTQGPNRLLLNFQGFSPFVGTGKAVLFTTATGDTADAASGAAEIGALATAPPFASGLGPSVRSSDLPGQPVPAVPLASGGAADPTVVADRGSDLEIAGVPAKPDDLTVAAGLSNPLETPSNPERF